MNAPVVIIGTGLAGYNVAREFRKLDSETPLLLITADDGRSYSKPMLSTGFGKNKEADGLSMAEPGAMAEQLKAEVRTHTRVSGIDPGHKRLWIGGGEVETLATASGAVTDLEPAHQARRLTPAAERFVRRPQVREVGPRAAAILEQPRLAGPQVHDPAFIDKIVADRLDKARVRLGVRVRIVREPKLAGLGVGDPVALCWSIDAIRPVEPGVEPLGAVGRAHLVDHHVLEFVLERLGVLGGIEVAVLFAPEPPAAREAMDHLLGGLLGTKL